MNNRKAFYRLSGCLVLAIVVVWVLYASSARPGQDRNEFKRLYPPHVLSDHKELNIGSNTFYVSGNSKTRIYLSDYNNPAILLITDLNLKSVQRIVLDLPEADKIIRQSATVSVDSPDICVMEGVTPVLLRGTLSSPHLKAVPGNLIYFNSAVPISKSSFAMRTYDGRLGQNILTKFSFDAALKRAPKVLQKQIDGLFCTDGQIHYCGFLNRLVYVYFFRNQFICLDTNLNLVYRGKTIDTNSVAKIKVAKIRGGQTSTLRAPPLNVNYTSCVDGPLLYINSRLRAKNESPQQFRQCSVVDIYSLVSGVYKYSFCIPDLNGKKLTSFKVISNTVFVLQGDYLSAFHLKLP